MEAVAEEVGPGEPEQGVAAESAPLVSFPPDCLLEDIRWVPSQKGGPWLSVPKAWDATWREHQALCHCCGRETRVFHLYVQRAEVRWRRQKAGRPHGPGGTNFFFGFVPVEPHVFVVRSEILKHTVDSIPVLQIGRPWFHVYSDGSYLWLTLCHGLF